MSPLSHGIRPFSVRRARRQVTVHVEALAQIADLITQANLHYTKAYAALKSGDLTTYASEMVQVGKILDQLATLTASAKVSPTPTPAPSP